MKQHTVVGIIGGMGPQASNHLHKRILELHSELLDVSETDEFPLIAHISIPAVDFISQPELRHQNHQLLRRAIKSINICKPDFVIMACNTAHLLVEEIDELKNLPLISLPGSVVASLLQLQNIYRVGLLASPTTIRQKIYAELAEPAGIELVLPDDRDLEQTEQIIRRVIGNASSEQDVRELNRIIDGLLNESQCEKVVLGCTELSVLINNRRRSNCIDALETSAQHLIEMIRQKERVVI